MPALVSLLLVVLFGILLAVTAIIGGVDSRDGRDWRRCVACGRARAGNGA